MDNQNNNNNNKKKNKKKKGPARVTISGRDDVELNPSNIAGRKGTASRIPAPVYYDLAMKHRAIPNMDQDFANIHSNFLKVPTQKRSATQKRFMKAYQLIYDLQESLQYADSYELVGEDNSMEELIQDDDYVQNCARLIQCVTLTDFRAAMPTIVLEQMKRARVLSHTHDLNYISRTEMQMLNVGAKAFMVLLANAVSLCCQELYAQALSVIHELHAHVESLHWKELEEDRTTTPLTKEDLLFSLACVGIKAGRAMYKKRSRRRATPSSAEATTDMLLDSVETLANELVVLRPGSPMGYWYLGFIARESVAKRKWHGLRGAAECLFQMRKCYAAADAEDNDHMKANARMEAATCLCLGADGLVSYSINGDPAQARRNFRMDPDHFQVSSIIEVYGGETVRRGAIEKETKRQEAGVPFTTFEPGEGSLVPRWDVLKLWNETMDIYDSLKEWEHHFFIYGETTGWDVVSDFLVRTKSYHRSQYANAGNFGIGFLVHQDRGGLRQSCSVCGKKEDRPTLHCARCKKAVYCSRDCQMKDWKTGHKQLCKKKN